MSAPQVALVTGASRGLGAEIARALAAEGVRVGLLARDAVAVERLARQLGPGALALPADVGHRPAVDEAVARLVEELGPLTILVSNAATFGPVAPLSETDPAEWERVQRVNVLGAYYCLRAALPILAAGGRGQVLGITSGAARNTLRFHSAYNTSKAAFEHLHRLADAEVRESGVGVAVLDPGGMETDMLRGLLEEAFPDRPTFAALRAAGKFRAAADVGAAACALLMAGVSPGRRYHIDELVT